MRRVGSSLLGLAIVALLAAPAFGQSEPTPVFKPGGTNNSSAPRPPPPPPPSPVSSAADADTSVKGKRESAFAFFRFNGYIQPQFDFRYRPKAFPRDRYNYGAGATTTGLILSGNPISKWSYTFHLVVSGGLLNTISSVQTVDRDGDGDPDSLDTRRETSAGLFIERAVVDYRPIESLRLRLGQMRIPFTIQNQSPNFALMFPDRSGPNQFFLSGTDLGGLVTYEHERFQVSGGIYNGTGSNDTGSSTRGVLYALRFDAHPLGEFPFSEIQNRRGPLRAGFGAGVLYFPSERFDNSGFEGINVRDLRASLSVRMAVAGFYAQAEVLRRQQTDNLSSRPIVATGSYLQTSYYIPMSEGSWGITPIARGGVTVEDQSFEPRTTVLTEGGVALHFHKNPWTQDSIKLIVQYFGELRLTEEENAHGATTQLQLRF